MNWKNSLYSDLQILLIFSNGLCIEHMYIFIQGFPSGSVVKNPADNAGDVGW